MTRSLTEILVERSLTLAEECDLITPIIGSSFDRQIHHARVLRYQCFMLADGVVWGPLTRIIRTWQQVRT